MASVRQLKKDIDYLVNEVVSDCYMALYFHADKKEAIVAIMQKAISLRNELFEMTNNPAEKHNKSLVKKHYAFVRSQMLDKIDELFASLSNLCKTAA